MYSSRFTHFRIARPRYASTSSPRSPQSNNTMFLLAGAAAAVGAYYYLRRSPEDDVSAKAKRDEQIMTQKARESLEAGRARADDARKQAEQKFDETKKTVIEEKLQAGKARLKSAEEEAEKMLHDAESRMRELGAKAHDSTEQKVEEAREEAKRGWSSWLGWGRSKTQEQEARLDEAKRAAASKVANAAEDVKQRAEKHT